MDWNSGGLLRLLIGERFSDLQAYNRIYVFLMLGVAVLSYLLGSIRPSLLLTKPGRKAENFLQAAPGLLLDFLCCAFALALGGLSVGFMFIGGLSYSDGCYVAALFCLFGYAFPAFHKFNGGIAVYPIAVSCLLLSPIAFAILALLYLAVLAASKYRALAAVSVAAVYPIVINGYYKVLAVSPEPGLAAVATILSAILSVYFYRENLSRISSQTEEKFSFSSWKDYFKPAKKEARDENDRQND